MCVKAVASIPNLNFAGVDVMEYEKENYLIEINGNPGEQIIDIAGHNYFEDLIDFCEINHKKKTGTSPGSGTLTSIISLKYLNKSFGEIESDFVVEHNKDTLLCIRFIGKARGLDSTEEIIQMIEKYITTGEL